MIRLPAPVIRIVADNRLRRPYLSAKGERMNAPRGRPTKPTANTAKLAIKDERASLAGNIWPANTPAR